MKIHALQSEVQKHSKTQKIMFSRSEINFNLALVFILDGHVTLITVKQRYSFALKY